MGCGVSKLLSQGNLGRGGFWVWWVGLDESRRVGWVW